MYYLKVIRHSEVTQSDLDEIIKIKSVAWPYPYDEQVNWIENNLTDYDLHVVLLLNKCQPVAYLNLVERDFKVNDDKIAVLGVGNVCSVEPGKGYGSKLMEKVSEYIVDNNKIGLLFCKRELVNFYRKYGWEKRKITNLDSLCINSMVCHFIIPNDIEIIYEGQLF